MSLNPFKKPKEDINGLSSFMDPAVGLIRSLNDIGGFSYVLFGAGFALIIFLINAGTSIAETIGVWLLPLAITLIAAGTILVVVWQLLEYNVSMLKLKMIISITEKMVDKKLESESNIDTAVMEKITRDILQNVWGLNVQLLPKPSNNANADEPS